MTVGADRFPGADAIILRQSQDWTLDGDGKVHRREYQLVKLLNARPIDRFGDPRIDFVDGEDEVIIHTARTHLPNGETLPVPDYSFNIAAPADVAGYPAYAGWQQKIVSFSGIQDGAVLELDYEVIGPPEAYPWIEFDLDLSDEYPTVHRAATIIVPEGANVMHRVTNVARLSPTSQPGAGSVTHRWVFEDLKADSHEPQAPHWTRRSGRLQLTTCPSVMEWTAAILGRVTTAATEPKDAIKKFAEDTVKDELSAAERARKLAKKLSDSFNFVNSQKALRGLHCRAANEVLQANYGNAMESGALLLAAMRSLGFDASPLVAVDGRLWEKDDPMAPSLAALDGVVIRVNVQPGDNESLYFHPQHGEFRNPGHWGRHWLLTVDAQGELATQYIYARGQRDPSRLDVSGKVTIAADGTATGELRISATGAFFDPMKLDKADAQKKFVEAMSRRILAGVEVPGHSISTLSDEQFAFTANLNLAADKGLEKVQELSVLRFGDGPAFLPDIPMPLARSARSTDVELAGPFRETMDVTVELPEGWSAAVVPSSPAPARGAWGTVAQTVEVKDRKIHFQRDISINRGNLSPAEFEVIRTAVNDLRCNQALTLAVGKAKGDEKQP